MCQIDTVNNCLMSADVDEQKSNDVNVKKNKYKSILVLDLFQVMQIVQNVDLFPKDQSNYK